MDMATGRSSAAMLILLHAGASHGYSMHGRAVSSLRPAAPAVTTLGQAQMVATIQPEHLARCGLAQKKPMGSSTACLSATSLTRARHTVHRSQ